MRLLMTLLAALLVACSNEQPGASAEAAQGSAPAPEQRQADDSPASNGSTGNFAGGAKAASDSRPAIQGRTGELVNPDHSTVVLLYYDLAHLTAPIDRWVEEDSRVLHAKPIDKAGLRASVRAELESAAAAVRGIGFIRLSMQANLSDYDPSYGEFTVRAFAPSSTVSFKAFGQDVSLRFGNGRIAQIWRVPPDQAQAIRDKLGYFHGVSLDALLRITAVQPAPGGGTLITEVVEYEMRDAQRGLTIGRVQVAQQ